MKLENNWRSKTLENLEKDNWGPPSLDDGLLVQRTMELRRIPLDQYFIEDLRIMIGQEFGLSYLLPIALEALEKNLFAEGEYFPGDLLNMVLQIKHSFWVENKVYWRQLDELIKGRMAELKEHKPSLHLDCFYSSKY